MVAVESVTREEIAHELGEALFGNELSVQQVAHPRGDARPVLDRGGYAEREGGWRQGAAGGAETTMGAMFGDLEGVWFGHIEDLPAGGVAVPVRVGERRATVRTGDGS